MHTVSKQTNALQNVLDDDRLEDVQLSNRTDVSIRKTDTLGRAHLELSTSTSNTDYSLVADDLRRNHSQRLTLCGVDLARHDTATRLVLWQRKLAESTTRARGEESNVVGNLHERASNDIQGTMRLDKCIMGRKRFELRKWSARETNDARS